LRPENGLTEAKKTSSNPSFPAENLFRIKKSTALALSMQNHAPAQGFHSWEKGDGRLGFVVTQPE
jgi:hypothetical protein